MYDHPHQFGDLHELLRDCTQFHGSEGSVAPSSGTSLKADFYHGVSNLLNEVWIQIRDVREAHGEVLGLGKYVDSCWTPLASKELAELGLFTAREAMNFKPISRRSTNGFLTTYKFAYETLSNSAIYQSTNKAAQNWFGDKTSIAFIDSLQSGFETAISSYMNIMLSAVWHLIKYRSETRDSDENRQTNDILMNPDQFQEFVKPLTQFISYLATMHLFTYGALNCETTFRSGLYRTRVIQMGSRLSIEPAPQLDPDTAKSTLDFASQIPTILPDVPRLGCPALRAKEGRSSFVNYVGDWVAEYFGKYIAPYIAFNA